LPKTFPCISSGGTLHLPLMKYLAIDYGSKKVGLALSDEGGRLASPYGIVPNNAQLKKVIEGLVQEHHIDIIVFGESKDQDGNPNQIHQRAENLARVLGDAIGKKIIFQDERWSSLSAKSHLYQKGNIANPRWSSTMNEKRRSDEDAEAATVILQRYLDTHNTIGE